MATHKKAPNAVWEPPVSVESSTLLLHTVLLNHDLFDNRDDSLTSFLLHSIKP